MKKKLVSGLLALLLIFTLFIPAYAEGEEALFIAEVCERDGNEYVCDGEYVILREDNTGEVCYSGSVYDIEWELSGSEITFTDSTGDSFTGTLDDGALDGNYMGYHYIYRISDDDIMSISGSETSDGETEGNEVPEDDEYIPTGVSRTESRTYRAESYSDGSNTYDCSGEYIILNDNGTGMVVYRRCAYGLDWKESGGSLTFEDSKGNYFDGTITDARIVGSFHGYTYTFKRDEEAPITAIAPEHWCKGLPLVTDRADILTDIEEAQLAEKAKEISEEYHCNVYLVTVDDMRNYTEFYSIEPFAEEVRTGYDLGYGNDRDCIMLLLSMAERDYDICAYGSFGNASFTDYGKDYLATKFLDDFRDNEWFAGCSDYISTCGVLLKRSAEGNPVDVGNQPVNPVFSIVVCLVIGFIIAWIICSAMKGKMKDTKEQTTAENYITPGGVAIPYRYDRYTHTTEVRVYDPPSKSSGGGGGGTSHSSSGHSHSSGKF